jgi:hypothetical protein
LQIPIGECFVVATFARMENARRRCTRLAGVIVVTGRRRVPFVIRFVGSLRLHGNDQRAVGISNDVHELCSSDEAPMCDAEHPVVPVPARSDSGHLSNGVK